MSLDLVIRGGTVATAEKTFQADVGIEGDKVAALGPALSGKRTIDAGGKLVLPGGVDSHCHIEQLSSMGVMTADDFYSATVSAAYGGTTTVIPFCAQHRNDDLRKVLADYHERARTKAVIDYGDRKSTRLNSSHVSISYAVFCLKKKKKRGWRLGVQNAKVVNHDYIQGVVDFAVF